MLCPHCGSQDIVYDFVHGYTVCTSCGCVVDVIFIDYFESGAPENGYADIGLPSVRKGLEKKKMASRLKRFSRISFEIMVYEKYAKKARKDVYIDLEAALNKELKRSSTSTRIYHHKDEVKVFSIIDKNPDIRLILENIVSQDPVLSSRTPRGKVALALIIKNIVDGTPVNLSYISELTSLSTVHVRRLVNLVKQRLQYIKPKLCNLFHSRDVKLIIE